MQADKYNAQAGMQPQQVYAGGQGAPVNGSTHMMWGIFNALCCLWPCGCAAAFFASQATAQNNEAQLNYAKWCNFVSTGGGCLTILIIVIVVVTAGAAASTSCGYYGCTDDDYYGYRVRRSVGEIVGNIGDHLKLSR
jgi:hypothetical protein